jgi:hypothetical protein
MRGARTIGRDYVEAVESSVKVAGHGVAFAADVVILCEHLNQGRDTSIRSFINEMRMIVRLAQSETNTTHGRFGAIRRKLYQVCCGTRSSLELLIEVANSSSRKFQFSKMILRMDRIIVSVSVPPQNFVTSTVHMSSLSGHTQRDLICTLELLRKAFEDIDHLVDGVAKFAHWWSEAENVISTFEKQMFVDGRRISLFQLGKAQKAWESVRDRYEVYSRVVSPTQ